jgi:hypothetical protein
MTIDKWGNLKGRSGLNVPCPAKRTKWCFGCGKKRLLWSMSVKHFVCTNPAGCSATAISLKEVDRLWVARCERTKGLRDKEGV